MTSHRPVVAVTVALSGVAVVAVVGLLVDDRTLLGVPIWLKPLKFAISLAVYTATLAWLTALVPGRPGRHAGRLGTVIGVAAAIEMAVIVGQAARGHRSHFNVATPLDTALWGVMGTTIVVLWIATAFVGVLLTRHHHGERPTVLAVRYGLLVALAGMAVGFLMTNATPAQRAAVAGGAGSPVIGAHAVGVPDGGAGLPVVNWSTVGGDLRVPHFVGLHALQALPLLAMALAHLARRVPALRPEPVRARLVTVAAAGLAGLTALLTLQALRGQPVLRPDAATATAAAVLVVAVAAGAAAGVRAHNRRAPAVARA